MIRPSIHHSILNQLDKLWNRGLSPDAHVTLQVRWPLILLPFVLINQLLTPHPAWMVMLIALVGLYMVSLFWVRSQTQAIELVREREGTIQVVGDSIREHFELKNQGALPLLWAELVDYSTVPSYRAGQVVACPASSSYAWRTSAECKRRGLYRLGPSVLRWGDPFGIFQAERSFPHGDTIIIYPRVLHLPSTTLPHGDTSGVDRRRRPLLGSSRATSVREYQPGDSLRYIHWPITAHRSTLMVTELDAEPSGDVWIVLDLNAAVHQGEDDDSTTEFAIIVAASLAAELLGRSERQAVGLMTTSGALSDALDSAPETILIPPQPGPAQLWRILAALAPVRTSDIPLVRLLQSGQHSLGRGRVLAVITPELTVLPDKGSTSPGQPDAKEPADELDAEFVEERLARSPKPGDEAEVEGIFAWAAELVHLQTRGVNSSVTIVTPMNEDHAVSQMQHQPDGQPGIRLTEEEQVAYTRLRGLLAGYSTPVQVLRAGMPLRPALTYRRTRSIIRSTPTGGAVTVEVEEEVG